jgi:uncharacterized membrane protein
MPGILPLASAWLFLFDAPRYSLFAFLNLLVSLSVFFVALPSRRPRERAGELGLEGENGANSAEDR